MQKRRYSIRAHEKSAKCSVGVGLKGFKSFLILLAAPQCTQEATASSRGDAQTYKDNIISKRWANLGIKLKELKSRFLCRGYIIFWQKIQKQKYHVCVPINPSAQMLQNLAYVLICPGRHFKQRKILLVGKQMLDHYKKSVINESLLADT